MSAEHYLLLGLAVVAAAWIPLFLKRLPLSLPMLALACGWLVALLVPHSMPGIDAATVVHVTEILLISAIYRAGLNVDRRFAFLAWETTWRLLLVVMPVSIALIACVAWQLFGLSLGLCIIAGAVLAPTDPVLASHLQLGPPGRGEEGEVRFGLTTEAGLNDGLAFPFILLGLGILDGSIADWRGLGYWAAIDLLGQPLAGAAIGAAVGLVVVAVNDRLPKRFRLRASENGLVGIGAAFVVYAVCEALHVNGFVGVFCHAVAIRNALPAHHFARRLSHATEHIERVFSVGVFAGFGLVLGSGLFVVLAPRDYLLAAAVLLLIRPLATLAGVSRTTLDWRARVGLGYFGVRGVGSIYYLAYVAGELPGAASAPLLRMVGATVLCSILLYGLTSGIVLSRVVDAGQPSADIG